MITILKAEDISEKAFKNKIEVYTLKEDDTLILTCAFRIRKNTVEIQDIAGHLQDTLLVDALVRAVSSYAQGRGADVASCRNRNLYEVLTSLGFQKDKNCLSAKITYLLRHQCCGRDNHDI